MELRIGVAADDLTGATDIGAMFSAAGFETVAFTSTDAARDYLASHPRPEVAIIDTASRYDAPEKAYRAASEAVAALRDAGATRFFKKTCSVFRGNVGREFDAMLDVLGEDFAIVVPGYPRNRRVMQYGVMYAAGVPLSESHFAGDPFHPARRSNLVDVLRHETARTVCLVDRDVVRRGADAVRTRIEQLRTACSYPVADVPDDAALSVVAAAVRNERLFGGSAGLAGALAPLWRPGAAPSVLPPQPAPSALGIPVISGSVTPITARQVEEFRRWGAVVVEVRAAALLDGSTAGMETERAAREAENALRSGRGVAVISPGTPEALAASDSAAKAAGLDATSAGSVISDGLADIMARVLRATAQDRLIIAGGDTAAAVCRRLGVRSLRVGEGVEPGIPFCDATGDSSVRLLLKGGSMGADDVIVRAAERLAAP